jgi:hypothetical protein
MPIARTPNKYCDPRRHVKGCHPARPRCRWMRKVQEQRRVCKCEAYLFPHRVGSGWCGKPELKWAEIAKADEARAHRERLGL